jgi:hypothetical protein
MTSFCARLASRYRHHCVISAGFGVVPIQQLDEAQTGQQVREVYFKRAAMKLRWVDPEGPLRQTFGVRGIVRTTVCFAPELGSGVV